MKYFFQLTTIRISLLAVQSRRFQRPSLTCFRWNDNNNNARNIKYPSVLISSPYEQRCISWKNKLIKLFDNTRFAFACIIRSMYITIIFSPAILSFPLYFLFPSFRPKWNHLFLFTLEQLGPTFLKLGQWISTRPDIFPGDLTKTLCKLHSDVNPEFVEIMKRILGRSIDISEFDWIDPNPIGAGCIAQVHRASFRGKLVAVKIRRPFIVEKIQKDVAIMRFIASLINWIPSMKWLSLPEEVEEFRKLMELQLDLRVEANNLKRFTTNFQGDERVIFPRAIYPFVTEEVLVEEYVHGVSLGKVLSISNERLKKSISNVGLKSFMKMMLLHNFIHSDLHPGNIIVQMRKKNGAILTDNEFDSIQEMGMICDEISLDEPPKLAFLDTGLVTELNETNRENFIDLFCAIADGDGVRVAHLMVERSRSIDSNEPKCINYSGFESKMENIVGLIQRQTFQLANINISHVLGSVLALVREHHVKIESDFTNLVVSIMVLEGIGRQLDPDLDLFEAARPFLRRRDTKFYSQYGGIFLKLSAFLEARYWLKKIHSRQHEILDILTFNNF